MPGNHVIAQAAIERAHRQFTGLTGLSSHICQWIGGARAQSPPAGFRSSLCLSHFGAAATAVEGAGANRVAAIGAGCDLLACSCSCAGRLRAGVWRLIWPPCWRGTGATRRGRGRSRRLIEGRRRIVGGRRGGKLLRRVGFALDLLQLRLVLLDIVVQFQNAGAQATQLGIVQCALHIKTHRCLRQIVRQLQSLLQELINFALLAAHTQLFLSFPARAADCRAYKALCGLYKIGHNLPSPSPVLSLDSVFSSLLSIFSNCMRINTYLLHSTITAQLYGDDIDSP